MDITKIRLKGPVTIDLPIRGAKASDPYVLKAADGLGPPEVSVFMGPGYSGKSIYQGRRPLDREIVFLISLNPSYKTAQTVGSMRENLYNFFTESGFQVLLMEGDKELCGALGYLKKVEINPFTSKPEVQLTISCASPTFVVAGDILVPENTATLAKANPVFINKGTAPSGMLIELTLTQDIPFFEMKQYNADQYADVDVFKINRPLVAGNTITIIGYPGFFTVYKMTGSDFATFADLGPNLTRDTVFPKLHQGPNPYVINTDKFTWKQVAIQYEWWGI